MTLRSHWIPLAAVTASLVAGCAAQRRPDLPRPTKPIKLVAVLPIEATPASTAQKRMPADAGRAVTGQVYAALANRSDFRFVPDLTVEDAVKAPNIVNAASPEARAVELGKAVSADAVIFGTVSRFDERVGTEYGATSPASVAFDLALLETASNAVVWRGQYADTQASLSTNLLQFWMFWESGPRWISARELSRIGADRLIGEMRTSSRTEDEVQRKSSWWSF